MFIVYLHEPGLEGTADAWEYTVSILTPTKKSTDRWNTKFITHEAAPRCWIDFGSNMSKIDIKVCECWWGVSVVYGHSPDGSTICCWPCKHWHAYRQKIICCYSIFSRSFVEPHDFQCPNDLDLIMDTVGHRTPS